MPLFSVLARDVVTGYDQFMVMTGYRFFPQFICMVYSLYFLAVMTSIT